MLDGPMHTLGPGSGSNPAAMAPPIAAWPHDRETAFDVATMMASNEAEQLSAAVQAVVEGRARNSSHNASAAQPMFDVTSEASADLQARLLELHHAEVQAQQIKTDVRARQEAAAVAEVAALGAARDDASSDTAAVAAVEHAILADVARFLDGSQAYVESDDD